MYSVDGTPTDCVNIAIDEVLEGPPDLVVSGINKGLNVGDDVTYSGTVAGALEGALLGYPSLAVSLQFTRGEWDFGPAAAAAASLGAAMLERPLPFRTFLNINVPQGQPKGVRVTVQAKRNHITKVDRRLDPRQRPYFWIEEAQDDWEPHDRSDRQAIQDGFVVGHAAAAGSHRPRRDRDRRSAHAGRVQDCLKPATRSMATKNACHTERSLASCLRPAAVNL